MGEVDASQGADICKARRVVKNGCELLIPSKVLSPLR